VLTAADLEMNVLDLRQRSFQFDRLADVPGGPYALFGRTETESERQLRPKLVRLTVVAPLAWVVLDEAADALRVAAPGASRATSQDPAVEVAAEPSEFEEGGLRWRRIVAGGGYVYAPAKLAEELLSRDGLRALGLG
jgi:hypothetical protein